MTAIASNGTGGGVASAGASWAGGVAPAEGDTCTIVNGDTITIDANWTVGADSATAAIDVLSGGILTWDGLGAADIVICKGNFYVRNGGTLTITGTADVTKTLTIKLNYSASLAAGKYGMIVEDGAIVSLQGFNKTRSWDTLSATAANGQKVCVTTNDNSAVWYTADTFAVGSMTRRGTTGAETDTIGSFAGTSITKAGANYTYAHDQNVAIINLARNVVITSYNTSYNGYILLYNTTLANFDCDWVEFSYLGSNSANKNGIAYSGVTVRADFNNCSFHHMYSGVAGASLTTTQTFNVQNCVFYATTSYSLVAANYAGTNSNNVIMAPAGGTGDLGATTGATLSGNHYANCGLHGVNLSGPATISSCKIYGVVTNGFTITSGASGVSLGSITIDNCGVGILLQGSAVQVAAGSTLTFGGTIANTTDISQTGFENTIRANTTTLTVTNTGGRLSVYDGSANHKTWTAYGSFSKSTTNPRTGTFALRMSPTNASNTLTATSTVPAANGVQVVVTAYFQKNAAYGSGNEPYLRLSGAGVVTDTDTLADVSGTWQLLVVSGTPTEDGFCKVEFVCQSAGVGAAVDVDDVKMVYTAIDTGGMDYWYEGNLPTVLMSTGLGATDVWAAATSGMTAAGTIGKLLVDDIDAAISSRLAAAGYTTPPTVTQIRQEMDANSVDLDDLLTRLSAARALLLDNLINLDATVTGIPADMLAEVVEGAYTFAEILRLMSSALFGRSSGGGTPNVAFRDLANTKNRIAATVAAGGNRTGVALDGT